MVIDTQTTFGQRVLQRLEKERVAWLTTVDSKNSPQPRPIWFLWDGETILFYSKPGTYKLDHIDRNPRVSLHFDGDGYGGDIVVIIGEAILDPSTPPADKNFLYVEKYGWGFDRIRMTAEEFAASYSIAVRIKPFWLRGH